MVLTRHDNHFQNYRKLHKILPIGLIFLLAPVNFTKYSNILTHAHFNNII